MEMMAVESSTIVAIGYAPTTSTLAVMFKNGDIYHYAGVPLTECMSLQAAESKGRYLHRHIKPVYTATKQPPPSLPAEDAKEGVPNGDDPRV